MRRTLAVVACLALASAVSGCVGGAAEADGVELTVSAASSLSAAFTEIGEEFERRNAGVVVTFNFGPSDGLATQIQEGVSVDVFASASPTWMDAVQDEPGVRGRVDFARNRLAIVVPADNPAEISSLEDLAAPGVALVLAAEGVPAGDYAREILSDAGIADAALANVVSNEVDVKGVMTKLLAVFESHDSEEAAVASFARAD